MKDDDWCLLLIQNLRDYANFEHDDRNVAHEAADAIIVLKENLRIANATRKNLLLTIKSLQDEVESCHNML